MANKTEKILLNAAEFPFTYANTPRTAIINSDIAPRMPGFFYGDKANADLGTVKLLYCENVLPFAKGIYSVTYTTEIAAISPAFTAVDQVITLRDSLEHVFMFVPGAGANYICDASTGLWSQLSPFTFGASLVTKAYVNGRTFICYEKTKIVEYDSVGNLLNDITLTFPVGTTIADVRGISGASNYLIFFTDFTIFWSSPLDLLDFSDIDAGAGNQTPIDIKGQIAACLPIAGGFLVYTTRNVVAAFFTNDAANPFIFKEVENSGGVTSWERISESSKDSGHYMYGTNGLQLVTMQRADSVFPEVTDFLVGKQIEHWNSTTKRVELATSGLVMSVKLAFLAGRFLVISYGVGTTYFEFALVYDTVLERWGKLRIDHADAFMYPYPLGTGAYTYDKLEGYYDMLLRDYRALDYLFLAVIPPKKGLAFIDIYGTVKIVSTDFAETSASGVAVFGHISLKHSNFTTFTEAVFDGLRNTPTPVVSILSSSDGVDRDQTTTMQLASDATASYKRYRSRVSAWNHDLAIEGTFVLSTALVGVMPHGYR